MEAGRSFDNVAAVYDAQRSGYPQKLFEDLSAIAILRKGDRVLEVGCGSGQATTGLVAQGFDIIAIDPGPSLVDLARQKFARSPRIQFAVASFEEWILGDQQFDLVAAAQSWHWVRPEIGFAKAAKALLPAGHLAIFGHRPAWSAELIERLEPVYRRLAPEIWGPLPEDWYLPSGPISGQFVASGRFESAVHRSYAWRRKYSSTGFAAYLGTRSDHIRLTRERRDELLTEVEANLPEEVDAAWVTNLYIAAVRRP
jgi:ubiquinone/menaquinone biosynthesis C-methylase UbiE